MQICDIPINEDLRETTEHGTPAFPFALYRTYLSRNVLGFINWHWHDEIQLCLITEGKVRFSVQEKEIVLQKGQSILINSRILHRCLPSEPTPFNAYICIDFSPRMISGFAGSLLESKYIYPFINSSCRYVAFDNSHPEDSAISSSISEIVDLHESANPVKEILINSLLLQIMASVIQRTAATETQTSSSGNFAFAQKIIEYLKRNIANDISLEDIENEVNISKEEICRKFKSV